MKQEKTSKKLKKLTLAILAGVFLFLSWLNFPFYTTFTVFAQKPYLQNATKTPKKDLLLSRFTTYFDENNIPRTHNIRLACQFLDGCKIESGGQFSFNLAVGKRTKERGFADAPVIFEGAFVLGTGGGVCQVSTTLYNAALIAGMGITEVHPHSLQVGYVPPSLDAMVSSVSDMKFVNATKAVVAIRMYADKNSVTAEIYGKSTGYRYSAESVTLCTVPPPAPEIIEGDEDCTVKQQKDGLKSESYLTYYRHGKKIKSVRIRRDTYAYIRGIEQKKPVQRPYEGIQERKTQEESNSFEKFTQND